MSIVSQLHLSSSLLCDPAGEDGVASIWDSLGGKGKKLMDFG
jgi:hypothetical protein